METNSEIKSVADVEKVDVDIEKEDKIEAIESDIISDINEEFKNSDTSVEEKKGKEDDKDKPNVFNELTNSMREKRSSLLSKIDDIKVLREKLKGLNKTGVRSLERKKEKLEFKISTEAITLDKERALMKEIKNLDEEIKLASNTSDNRKDILAKIKKLDGEIEILKNELDEMKLSLINLREERKKRKLLIKKKKEARAARAERGETQRRKREDKAPTAEEMFVSLEDIVVINKK